MATQNEIGNYRNKQFSADSSINCDINKYLMHLTKMELKISQPSRTENFLWELRLIMYLVW